MVKGDNFLLEIAHFFNETCMTFRKIHFFFLSQKLRLTEAVASFLQQYPYIRLNRLS